MIRWCSYCQRYLGEKEPFDSYDLTHTICGNCLESGVHLEDDLDERLAPVVALFDGLRRAAQEGDFLLARRALVKGLGMGLRPQDLLMGLLQPTLKRVGERWVSGAMSVAQEHRFTSIASALIDLTFSHFDQFQPLRQSARPRILLTNAEGNFHQLGLRILEFFLVANGIPCFSVLPGLPISGVLGLAATLQVPFIGVSVALADQVGGVRALAEQIGGLDPSRRPRLLLGGHLFCDGFRPAADHPWEVCSNAGMALDLLTVPFPPLSKAG